MPEGDSGNLVTIPYHSILPVSISMSPRVMKFAQIGTFALTLYGNFQFDGYMSPTGCLTSVGVSEQHSILGVAECPAGLILGSITNVNPLDVLGSMRSSDESEYKL